MADWSKITSRGDVEDRRSMGPVQLGGLGGGLGVVGLVIFLIVNLSGGSTKHPILSSILSDLQNVQATQQPSTTTFSDPTQFKTFSEEVLGSNNDTWTGIFKQSGKTYTPPKLILFRTATQSGCGIAEASVGPFFCPNDQSIYLDETFFGELQQRFHAKGGDVAEAYVIAHEAGHNVQQELGITDKVQSNQGAASDSVRLELQADCFAGVWAHSVAQQGVIQPGEISQALDAAAAVGDDHIQQTLDGHVTPETWTHGSSAERVNWFTKGYDSGKPADCDTFNATL